MTDYLEFDPKLDDPAVADAFDDFTYWSSLFGRLLFRHVPLAAGSRALDVGCGTGFPLFELADRLGPTSVVHGIDAWDHAVARARRKVAVRGHDHVKIHLGDASCMPYSEGSMDLIVSNLGINNFDEPERVMSECGRVCRRGGRLAMTTNLVGHMGEFYDLFAEVLADTGHAALVDALREQEAHRATIPAMEALLTGAGFEMTVCHREEFVLRYANGSAFLRAYLTRLGFLGGWSGIVAATDQEPAIFLEVEERLNRLAARNGELRLTIPAAYLEGQRS